MQQSYAGLALDRNQIERQSNRTDAVMAISRRAGHRFIPLTLAELRKRSIAGVEYVHATPYIDAEMGGLTNYHIEVRGGSLSFQFFGGAFTAQLLDTEHNRQFLASHYDRGYWHIDDPDVERDIAQRYDKIRRALIRQAPAIAAARAAKLAENERMMKTSPQIQQHRLDTPGTVSVPVDTLPFVTADDDTGENTLDDITVEDAPKKKTTRKKAARKPAPGRKRGRPSKSTQPAQKAAHVSLKHAPPIVTGLPQNEGFVTVGAGVKAP